MIKWKEKENIIMGTGVNTMEALCMGIDMEKAHIDGQVESIIKVKFYFY
jgi:hypothetical protein